MTVAARASLTLALIASSATVITLHHTHKRPASSATLVAPTGAVLSLVREPVPPRRVSTRASRRRARPALRVVATAASRYADVTMYCATGNRNAAGRWPALGDVAVIDRRIPFGTRVLIDGNVYTVRDWIGWGSSFDIFGGNDAGCEQRAINFGRRHLRVVVER